MTNGRQVDRSGVYRIQVIGTLDAGLEKRIDGFSITQQGENEIMLIGRLADQTALYGLLDVLRDLRLPLLCLECVEATSS